VSTGKGDREISQRTEDAVINLVMTRLAEKGHYSATLDSMDPAGRALVESSLERHAAAERAAGKPGW
jgi:hypothetical protein